MLFMPVEGQLSDLLQSSHFWTQNSSPAVRLGSREPSGSFRFQVSHRKRPVDSKKNSLNATATLIGILSSTVTVVAYIFSSGGSLLEALGAFLQSLVGAFLPGIDQFFSDVAASMAEFVII